ncbi:MAG: ATP synthase subunit I [Zoogloeaceae bacterium]|jgi:ATP synthase protein I|nr:ATP synthase subunit I [Zoogloeaceae bacterium]
MRKAVLFQWGAVLSLVVLAGLIVGMRGAVSAGLAGLAAVLPNFWFAWRLQVSARRPGGMSAVKFLAGELVKIAATAGLLSVAVKLYPDLHWPTFLLSLLVVLQASFLAFWKKP